MDRLREAIGLGLILGAFHGAAHAVPVVPNFTQGSMSSHTETTQTITETINSMDYNTGYQYSATGSGICLLYTSPSPRDATLSRMPSSA